MGFQLGWRRKCVRNFVRETSWKSEKTEAVCSSELFVSTYKYTRRFNPEDKHRRLYRHENLKSHNKANVRKLCLQLRICINGT
jgi:hypothetical protein